jgi:hypothetical protein
MSSTLVTPLLISYPFGFGAANPTYINIPIPVPSQIGTTVNAASFTDGFPPSTMTPEASGGLPFFGQDMNGILYMVSAYCANFAAGALPVYNATLAGNISGYPLGAVLANTQGNGLWINQSNGNSSNPDTGGANWAPAACVGGVPITCGGSNITLTQLQSTYAFILFSGTLTANVTVSFPVGAESGGKQWIIVNECSGAFSLSVATVAGGTPIVIPQQGGAGTSFPAVVYCDGVNLQFLITALTGFAPLNSPGFTGTPTGPTASATSNTAQLATTAMVQAAITAALAPYAPIASPIFTGTPTVPTPPTSSDSAQIANTEWVLGNMRFGTFTTSASSTPINFSPAFPNGIRGLWLTPLSVTNAWYLSGAPTRTGFTVVNASGVSMMYTAWGF